MEGWGVALILGVVEGLTEFIPVSSTGHLIIASHLLGFFGEKAATFQVAIQFGAILAVVLLYWPRFADLLPLSKNHPKCKNSNLAGWAGMWRITAATLPALVVGYLTKDLITTYLFAPWAVTVALAGGGIVILVAERLLRRRKSRPSEWGYFRFLRCGPALHDPLPRSLAVWFWVLTGREPRNFRF
jgi:undecaprenyl-diphosphatase